MELNKLLEKWIEQGKRPHEVLCIFLEERDRFMKEENTYGNPSNSTTSEEARAHAERIKQKMPEHYPQIMRAVEKRLYTK